MLCHSLDVSSSNRQGRRRPKPIARNYRVACPKASPISAVVQTTPFLLLS
jgi:hypothetical protein